MDPNVFKIGYMIEGYPKRIAAMKLLESTTFGIFYKYSKLQQGYYLT